MFIIIYLFSFSQILSSKINQKLVQFTLESISPNFFVKKWQIFAREKIKL
jgi:hypothetical protein